MADGDAPAEEPSSRGGSGWGGGVIVLIAIGAAVKFFGDGQADRPVAPAADDMHPIVASAPPVAPATAAVGPTDPRAGTAPVARGRSPLEALGWNRSRCMLCERQRTRQDAARFIDSEGFGFCADCGNGANAFTTNRANLDQGFGSDYRTEPLAKAYTEAIGNRYLLPYMAAFMQWGDDPAWREAWHNLAIVTVSGYSGGR